MFTHHIPIRVRYAETDQMGYVYYGNYATYYEVARVEAMRKVGFSYRDMEKNGIMMPVLNLQCDFKSPGYYDELLNIRISVIEMPTVRMLFHYELTGEDGRLVNVGKTTLVFVSTSSGKPVRIPKEVQVLFEPYFNVK